MLIRWKYVAIDSFPSVVFNVASSLIVSCTISLLPLKKLNKNCFLFSVKSNSLFFKIYLWKFFRKSLWFTSTTFTKSWKEELPLELVKSIAMISDDPVVEFLSFTSCCSFKVKSYFLCLSMNFWVSSSSFLLCFWENLNIFGEP